MHTHYPRRSIQPLLVAALLPVFASACAMPAEEGTSASRLGRGPSMPTVTPAGGALDVRWTGNDGGWTAIDRAWPGCGGTCYENVAWLTDGESAWTDTMVTVGVGYRYKVWNASGRSAYSDPVFPNEPPPSEPPSSGGPVPSTPTVAQVGTEARLRVSWEGGDDGGSFVAVDRASDGCGGTCWENVAWLSPGEHEWVDTDVAYGSPYRYKVWNAAGQSEYSPPVTPTSTSAPEPPAGPASDTLPAGDWSLVWADEFDGPEGSFPGGAWRLGPTYGEETEPEVYAWRDAVYRRSECYLDGSGVLTLRAERSGGENRACFLATSDPRYGARAEFGPGETGTIYVEYRANVAQVNSHAAWFAGWLMSPHDTYDGNPATGSEVDVFEYVPFTNSSYTLDTLYHAAVHWRSDGTGTSKPAPFAPWISDYSQVDPMAAVATDLRDDAFHTYGVEWSGTEQRFYFDGHLVWTNTEGVSTAQNHGIILSIEIQNGDPWNVWGHPVGRFEDNAPSRASSHAYVDYVRVYRRPG